MCKNKRKYLIVHEIMFLKNDHPNNISCSDVRDIWL